MSKPNLTIPDSSRWDSKSDSISTMVAPYVNAGPTDDYTVKTHISLVDMSRKLENMSSQNPA